MLNMYSYHYTALMTEKQELCEEAKKEDVAPCPAEVEEKQEADSSADCGSGDSNVTPAGKTLTCL